ncbi:MAG: ATP-binding cassette domain-containing protein [Saprospiraceae bacterium]|jgi:ABC-type methionine transport system ATPase subunit|nr:ATP-binding cassette domain-containing protein [Saprospiraceae bacterium]
MSSVSLFAANLLLESPRSHQIQVPALEVPVGSWVEIIANNAEGKTMIMNAFTGYLAFKQGQLKVLDFGMNPISAEDLSTLRRKIAYIRPFPDLVTDKTVRVNLSLALSAANRVLDADMEHLILQSLSMFGIEDLNKVIISQLSSSEQLLVQLARALIVKPKIIFIDNCFSILDSTKRRFVMDVLSSIRSKERCTIVLSGFEPTVPEEENALKYQIVRRSLIPME